MKPYNYFQILSLVTLLSVSYIYVVRKTNSLKSPPLRLEVLIANYVMAAHKQCSREMLLLLITNTNTNYRSLIYLHLNLINLMTNHI